MTQTIRDVMTTDVVQLDASANVRDAARAMREHGIGDVVVERDGKTCGIVTDRDLVVRCLADGDEGLQRDLGTLCSDDLVTVKPDSDVDDAIRLMEQTAVRRLPVMENDRAVGIVSLGDLALERTPTSTLGKVSRAPANN